MYSLILSSKLPSAKKFKKWVCSVLLPKIRKLGQDKFIKQLKEKDDLLSRLHSINAELLTFKKLSEREEYIYLISSYNLIIQGLIKVGRTKNLKARNSGHNTTHPKGDKMIILFAFKVNDSALVESTIHKKLAGLRPDKNSEFFMCPYDSLYDIVDLIVNYDCIENKAVNCLIDWVYKLKQNKYSHTDWTSGLDMNIFKEKMALIEDNKEVAKFDMTTATEPQKQEFIRGCIDTYKRTIQQPNELTIVWKTLQNIIQQQLNIKKAEFKVSIWKSLIKTEEENDEQLTIKWRK